ncbi:hypothetical protein AB0N19_07105 [Streptomyces sp. NPDC051132]|uniref:hypothetical protein n=1 Tax=Streptomyces sp. NPDC051132 TaxID=3155667 RepID=UPI0034409221
MSGARVLVAGATGALGGATTAEPAGRGARVALPGRDRGRLPHTVRAHSGAPAAGFDARDPGSRARAGHAAAAALQGLDAAVVASGPVAFGAAEETGAEPPRPGPGQSRGAEPLCPGPGRSRGAEPLCPGPGRSPGAERRDR